MENDPKKEPPAKFDPVCPHCGADPITVNLRDLVFPPALVILLASCAGCRKVLGVSFHRELPPRIIAADTPRFVS